MLGQIVGGLLVLVVAAAPFLIAREVDGWKGKTVAISVGVVIALVGGGLLTVGAAKAAVVAQADKEWSIEKTQRLASMANASEVSGHGGAFVTKIDEKNVIRYVQAHKDGSYSLEEVDADDAVIREDADKDSAHLDTEQCERDANVDAGLFLRCGHRYVFHVPKGTVSNDFSVDPGAN